MLIAIERQYLCYPGKVAEIICKPMALSDLRMSKKFSTGLFSAATACLALLTCGSAQADSVYDASSGILRIMGTGESITPGAGVQDSNWQLVAFPTTATVPNPAITTPVDVYIPGNTPAAWYPGSNPTNQGISGFGFDSGITYRWASVNSNNNANSFFSTSDITGNPSYSYVVSTTFDVTEAGTYTFNYNMSGDNRVSVYLGGAPFATTSPYSGSTGTFNPFGYVINGGQLLAATTLGPGNLKSGSGPDIGLAAGTYTLNYLVTDFYTSNSYGGTGLLVSTTYFQKNVPGPLPLLGAGAFFAHSRRLRRRIKAGNAAVS
ncbi:MAG: hypothetical protein NTY67_08455 [Cyanobacteria bacterium]|nr:hypothetical protein [Cyanobacteriota bacterium]